MAELMNYFECHENIRLMTEMMYFFECHQNNCLMSERKLSISLMSSNHVHVRDLENISDADRLASFGIMWDQLRTRLIPLGPSQLYGILGSLSGAFNLSPITPRDASLSAS